MRKRLSWSLSWSLSLSLGLLVVGCAREQEAVEVTWPDGSPRTAYVVLEGDTVGFRAWHENGQLDREGGLKDGQRDGKWQAFYDDGTPWAEHEYAAGVQIGAYRTWYPNGTPNIEGQYDADRRVAVLRPPRPRRPAHAGGLAAGRFLTAAGG